MGTIEYLALSSACALEKRERTTSNCESLLLVQEALSSSLTLHCKRKLVSDGLCTLSFVLCVYSYVHSFANRFNWSRFELNSVRVK